MAKSITIRNVPDEVLGELSARAARGGRSLQEYVRGELISMTSRPDPATWVSQVRGFKAGTASRVTSTSILRDRDAGRR